mmetsp:Transcript_13382/g.32705  ORF Transcript_13382/g.32705 Transcript_13382/m.32705 type:complete len:318 (-) Transcript_13382:602-1555(-)
MCKRPPKVSVVEHLWIRLEGVVAKVHLLYEHQSRELLGQRRELVVAEVEVDNKLILRVQVIRHLPHPRARRAAQHAVPAGGRPVEEHAIKAIRVALVADPEIVHLREAHVLAGRAEEVFEGRHDAFAVHAGHRVAPPARSVLDALPEEHLHACGGHVGEARDPPHLVPVRAVEGVGEVEGLESAEVVLPLRRLAPRHEVPQVDAVDKVDPWELEFYKGLLACGAWARVPRVPVEVPRVDGVALERHGHADAVDGVVGPARGRLHLALRIPILIGPRRSPGAHVGDVERAQEGEELVDVNLPALVEVDDLHDVLEVVV